MYELTCPSCSRVSAFAFVRVGAVPTCKHCGHRFVVQAQHVKCPTLPSADGASANPLILYPPVARPAPPQAQALASQRAARAEAQRSAVPAAPPAPSAEVADMIARRKRQRHRRVMLQSLSVTVSVVVLAILAGVALSLWRANRGLLHTRSPQAVAGAEDIPVTPAAVDQDQSDVLPPWTAPVLTPEPIAMGSWQSVSRMPDWVRRGGVVQLVTEQLLRLRGDEIYYTAALVVQDEQIVEQARLRLSLVDSAERVFAQMELPVSLLSRQQSRTIGLPVPAPLYDRMVDVLWHIEDVELLEQGVWVDELVVEPRGQWPQVSLRVTAYNPLHSELADMLFTVAGINSRGEEVAWWQAHWDQSVFPRQRVQFVVNLTSNSPADVTRWRVIGVGRRPAYDPQTFSPQAIRESDQPDTDHQP